MGLRYVDFRGVEACRCYVCREEGWIFRFARGYNVEMMLIAILRVLLFEGTVRDSFV